MLRSCIQIRSKGTVVSQFCRHSTKLAANIKVRHKNGCEDVLIDSIRSKKDLSSLFQLLNSNKYFLNEVRILSAFKVICNLYLNQSSPGFQENEKSKYLDLFKLLESRIEGFNLNYEVEEKNVKTSKRKHTRKKAIVEEKSQGVTPDCSISKEEKSLGTPTFFYYIFEKEGPIESKCLQEIYRNLKSSDLDFQEILDISLKIQEQVESKLEEFYDSTLFDSFADRALKCDVDFYELCKFLNVLVALRHKNTKIVDDVCNMYLDKISNNRVKCIRTSIKYFSSMKCKPQRWQEFVKTINFPELAKKLSPEQALSLSTNLASLDHFDENLLAAATNSSLDRFPIQRLILLWQKLKAANLDAEFFENHVKKYCDSWSTQEKTSPLLPTLIKALKDEIYIKNNCLTRLYHQIDHVICYRNGGFPIAINHRMVDMSSEKSSNFVEDLGAPTNSTLILLVYYPKNYFFRNSPELRDFAFDQLSLLKSASDNWQFLMIRESQWEEMSDRDKTLFLMKEINSKLPVVDPIQ